MVGIILASGESKRMGRNKLLLKYKGKEIIRWVIEKAKESNLQEVVVIYKDYEVKKISEELGINAIRNHNYTKGKSEAIKLGIRSLKEYKGYMFIVGDIPLITVNTINGLIENFEESGGIVVCRNKGKIKNPTIFDKKFIGELLNLQGDVGGTVIIENHLDDVIFFQINNEFELKDIDTELDYEELII